MELEFFVQFQLGNATEIFFQDGCFALELMFVAGMLIVAAAAALKVGASWLDALWGSFEDFVCTGAGKSGLLLGDRRFHPFTSQHKRHEHSLSTAMLIGRQAGQPVAAIN